MIPVEDFTGPAIADIKKFIQIMAEARRDGEVRYKMSQQALNRILAKKNHKSKRRKIREKFAYILGFWLYTYRSHFNLTNFKILVSRT